MNKISILLPYKENFSPDYAGAVSLYVKDTTKRSEYIKQITVYGSTKYKKIFNLNYVNIALDKHILKSGSKLYVQNFLKHEKKHPSEVIEIHNRPIYVKYISEEIGKKNIILYFHNDPLTMNGSKTKIDREYLLNIASKIIFNSQWSKKRFLEKLEVSTINSDKLLVIYQSADKPKINFKVKKKWITFVGKLNAAKGYDLFGIAVIKILKKFKDWHGVVIGDEPRQKLFFNHPR